MLIQIDHNLNGIDESNEYVIKNLKFVFSKLTKIMQPKTLTIWNYAFFHSICTYGIMSCGGAYKTVKSINTKLYKIKF